MAELSEKMMQEEKELKERFNESLGPDPQKAQAIALFGIYHVLNTLTRKLIILADDFGDIS